MRLLPAKWLSREPLYMRHPSEVGRIVGGSIWPRLRQAGAWTRDIVCGFGPCDGGNKEAHGVRFCTSCSGTYVFDRSQFNAFLSRAVDPEMWAAWRVCQEMQPFWTWADRQ